MVAPRGWEGGTGTYSLMGTESQFHKIKRVLGMDGGDGCTTVCMHFMPLNCALRNGYDSKFYVKCISPQ